MKEIQLKDAKAKLSAVVDRAAAVEPTVITLHGRKEADAGLLLAFGIEEARDAGPILGRARAHVPGFEDIAIAATAVS